MSIPRAVQFIAAAALVHRAAAFRRVALAPTRLASSLRTGRAVVAMAEPDEEQRRFAEHQKTAAKLPAEVEARSLVAYSTGWAVISTNSREDDGYPNGGLVAFAPGADGLPVFFFSSMSQHTKDLTASPKASLTVTAAGFDGADSGRINLMGDVVPVQGEAEVAAAREAYLAKHKDAFWINFGDFQPYKLQLKRARYVFGFARAGQLSAAEYAQVAPDPVLGFSAPVASHMNDDHADSTVAMIRHYVGLSVDSALITSVDSYGMFVKVARAAKAEPGAAPGRPGAPPPKEEFKMRLPFPRKAESRKDVKDLIVEMTRASASA